jgi:hypothetical protein
VLVLDEGNRELGAVLELAEEKRKRPEREAAKGELELRCANRHVTGYASPCRNPVSRPATAARVRQCLQPLWTSRSSRLISSRLP